MLPDVQSTFEIFAVHWRRVGPGWTYPEHAHSQFELNWVTRGCQIMTVEGRTVRQEAGDLLIVRPGEKHSGKTDGASEMAYFCLHFDVDDPLIRQMLCLLKDGHYTADSPVMQKIRPILQKWVKLTQKREDYRHEHRIRMFTAALELFTCLGELLSREENVLKVDSFHTLMLAQELSRRIEQEGSEFKHIRDIAGNMGYSPSYCNRVFKKVFGLSPRQYWSQLKLRKARLLLLNHDLSVETVSRMLGYKELAHFSKQFKRWTGMTPSEYRNQEPAKVKP